MADRSKIGSMAAGDVENISMLVSEIESDGKGVPTLIKHYLKLNGKLIAYHRRPGPFLCP